MDSVTEAIMLDQGKASYRYATLQPAWGVLTEVLNERRRELVEVMIKQLLLADGAYDGAAGGVSAGRISEIDVTLNILENLRLEVKSGR